MKLVLVDCLVLSISFATTKGQYHKLPRSDPCYVKDPIWFFDPSLKACRRNEHISNVDLFNRYPTLIRCLEDNGSSSDNNGYCEAAHERGPCGQIMPTFYFDQRTGECKRFIFGGCGGNGNTFFSERECLLNCKCRNPEICNY